jgi:hypothetical protein
MSIAGITDLHEYRFQIARYSDREIFEKMIALATEGSYRIEHTAM